MPDLVDLRRRLTEFAEREAAGVSPLYELLALGAAGDDEVAGLLGAARQGCATPALLLAAAHRLLQSEPFHELSGYYPSLGGACGPDQGTWPLFRSFVLDRADRMRALIATRGTASNDVRRAALLYPAVALAAKQAKAPVGLLQVGAGAGLLLLMDRFGLRYQTEQAGQLAVGPAKAPLGLHCVLGVAGDAPLPALPKKLPVAARIGLDPAPVDATDPDEFAWLEACVWADQPERLRWLGIAAGMLRKDRPDLVTGDPVEDLPAVAAKVPAELPLVVFDTDTTGQWDADRRAEYVRLLSVLSQRRQLWWVSHESYLSGLDLVLPGREDLVPRDGDPVVGTLGLVRWVQGRPQAQALARTGRHGQRLEWLPVG